MAAKKKPQKAKDCKALCAEAKRLDRVGDVAARKLDRAVRRVDATERKMKSRMRKELDAIWRIDVKPLQKEDERVFRQGQAAYKKLKAGRCQRVCKGKGK